MAGPSASIDAYLKDVEPDKRAALEALRKLIHQIAPGAEETISYGVPHLRLNGKNLVSFGAATKHCAFYPLSGQVIEKFKDDLANFSTSVGAVRFTPDKPLPEDVIRRMVAARMVENAEIAAAKAKPKG